MLTGNPGKTVDLIPDIFFPRFFTHGNIEISGNAEKQQQHYSEIGQRISDKNSRSALFDHALFLLPPIIVNPLEDPNILFAAVFPQLTHKSFPGLVCDALGDHCHDSGVHH